ncbi:MAG: CNNM domain-containing protein [Bacilli bacterium]|jgi:putative hemolysin
MDSMPWYLVLVIAILCLVASFIFTCAENSYSNCNIYHYKVLADDNKITAKLVYKMAKNFDDSLVTVLVGNNLAQAILSNVSAIFFLYLSGIYSWGDGVESIVSTIIVTLVLYLFGDFLPKIISKNYPDKMAEFISYPIFVFYIIFFPIIFIFRMFLRFIKKISHNKADIAITQEEFIDKADEAEDKVLEDDEKRILNRAFVFDKISVKQVLTLKENIFSLDIKTLTVPKLNKILLKVNYSRIPIYDGKKDNIIGILTIRSYFKEYINDNHLDLRSVIVPPLKVKETDKVDDIFRKFNDEKTHVALVYDAKNKLVGMITMEDVLEELVGDINEKNTTSIKIIKENENE